jgi:3-methylcrotonyl-CoA carboxylase alpha subunit
MFRKILIANRGEIACRVMQTTKRLGIRSVALYSDIDTYSKHVSMADYAYYVGGNKSSESYLNMNKIIEIALNSGAEAIHPGYGFLSENCDFVKLCEQNNLKFIGPNFHAIKVMGSKIESKKIMEQAKVPVVPGYFGDNQDKDFLINKAKEIQYPILIKADLGGGGKGMRIVHSENEFLEALSGAQNESAKSFGSAKILLERYIANSKHIEVQVFGDNYNNHVHLFERDCTIQRRHQKVVEEAPSNLSEEIRKQLCNTAVQAAKAVNYVNAGTVEFIYDIDKNQFFFMEMNTRLQVEHPISEMITGQDFVEWQLRVASGSRLPLKQEEIKRNGHAIEARIYSEDPKNNFLPGSGKIMFLHEPKHKFDQENEDPDVRIETGVRQGDSVSIFYDPMIAKLVCWAPSRELCIKKTLKCLEEYKVLFSIKFRF